MNTQEFQRITIPIFQTRLARLTKHTTNIRPLRIHDIQKRVATLKIFPVGGHQKAPGHSMKICTVSSILTNPEEIHTNRLHIQREKYILDRGLLRPTHRRSIMIPAMMMAIRKIIQNLGQCLRQPLEVKFPVKLRIHLHLRINAILFPWTTNLRLCQTFRQQHLNIAAA
jgi:hypothetical protein